MARPVTPEKIKLVELAQIKLEMGNKHNKQKKKILPRHTQQNEEE